MDFGHIPGGWPISETSKFDQVHLHVTFQEDEAKVLDCGLFKGELLHCEVETVLTEDVKDSYYDLMMLFFSLTTENEDVIHIDGHYPSLMSSLKMSFIIVWKMVRLFVNPWNISRGSKRPWFIWKAAFHLSPFLIHTLLYPHQMSSFMKYLVLALETLLRMSGIRGRG